MLVLEAEFVKHLNGHAGSPVRDHEDGATIGDGPLLLVRIYRSARGAARSGQAEAMQCLGEPLGSTGPRWCHPQRIKKFKCIACQHHSQPDGASGQPAARWALQQLHLAAAWPLQHWHPTPASPSSSSQASQLRKKLGASLFIGSGIGALNAGTGLGSGGGNGGPGGGGGDSGGGAGGSGGGGGDWGSGSSGSGGEAPNVLGDFALAIDAICSNDQSSASSGAESADLFVIVLDVSGGISAGVRDMPVAGAGGGGWEVWGMGLEVHRSREQIAAQRLSWRTCTSLIHLYPFGFDAVFASFASMNQHAWPCRLPCSTNNVHVTVVTP